MHGPSVKAWYDDSNLFLLIHFDSYHPFIEQTNTMQLITVRWGHSSFRITVGKESSQSIRYDNIWDSVGGLNEDLVEQFVFGKLLFEM